MGQFLKFAVQGLATGFVIALLAMSVVMIYRSTRVLSFAQGAIASLSTYVYYTFTTNWHWPAVLALPVTLLAAAAIGIVADVGVMRPLRHADALTRTVATLGFVLILQVVMRVVWTGGETFVRPLSRGHITVGSFAVTGQEVIIGVVAVAVAIALSWWTSRTYDGLGLSAIAQDAAAARLLGVNPTRASMLTWAIASALAALAGVLFTPLLVLNSMQMTFVMVTSFGAALAGGFVSLPLALFGGVAIGIVQSLSAGYISISGISEAMGFIAVFAVLLVTRSQRGTTFVLGRGAEL